MGVKSTYDLTRAEAIQKYADLKMAEVNVRRIFESEATIMSNTSLEDALEALNDAANGGEGFENYSIRNNSF